MRKRQTTWQLKRKLHKFTQKKPKNIRQGQTTWKL